MLERVWGCRLASSEFGDVLWQPTGLMGMLERVWGCRLATYRSYGAEWSEFGDVFWQPTGLMVHVGASLGLKVGNLQVLWGMLEPVRGCRLARSHGACWREFGAACWQPTGLVGHVGASSGL